MQRFLIRSGPDLYHLMTTEFVDGPDSAFQMDFAWTADTTSPQANLTISYYANGLIRFSGLLRWEIYAAPVFALRDSVMLACIGIPGGTALQSVGGEMQPHDQLVAILEPNDHAIQFQLILAPDDDEFALDLEGFKQSDMKVGSGSCYV